MGPSTSWRSDEVRIAAVQNRTTGAVAALPTFSAPAGLRWRFEWVGGSTGSATTRHPVPNCTMIDWDGVRYFLAVARGGSVRAAAERLGVNHSTVLRRVAHLEARLGAHLFEKRPSGYRLTTAGEEVLEYAERMETSSLQLETRVFGRDQGVRGL